MSFPVNLIRIDEHTSKNRTLLSVIIAAPEPLISITQQYTAIFSYMEKILQNLPLV